MKSPSLVCAATLSSLTIKSRWSVLAALLLVVGGPNSTVRAQDSTEITALYGRGVHAFFAGQPSAAEQMFSECVAAGSNDPRVYYFLGISRLRQGRQYEADEDLRVGAMLEARDPGLRYGIGNALQRIQGPERITLEKFRREARVDKVQQRRLQTRDRYEQLRSREADVLHRSQPVPLEQLVEPSVEFQGTGQTPAVQPAAPATTPTVLPDPAPVVTPAPAVEPAPAVVQPAAEEDLFGMPAAEPVVETPAAETPAVEPAPAAEDDLFGPESAEPAPAETPADSGDIFGSDTAPATDPGPAPAEAAPAETSTAEPVVEADPFGATEAPTDAPPTIAVPTETEPATSAESAEETPVEESVPAAEDDPFGAAEASAAETVPVEEAPAEEVPAEAAPAEEAATETTEESSEADPFGADSAETDSTETEDTTDTADDSASEDPVAEEPTESAESTEDPFGASDAEEVDNEEQDTEESEEAADESAEDVETSDDGDDAPADEPAEEEDPFGGF